MKITIAIIVHNRLENIKLWLHCWQQCEQHAAELVIIQNDCGSDEIEKYCAAYSIKHILRKNIGLDIGAFQDVCRERLKGFDNDWDVLLWITDDTFPMSKDFIAPYLKVLEKNAVACTDISPFIKRHIRTTGFAIKKETALKIQFDVDPVVTKKDCYDFEHKSKNAFYEQIIKMGLTAETVARREKNSLWDSGYKRGMKRRGEFDKLFPFDGLRVANAGERKLEQVQNVALRLTQDDIEVKRVANLLKVGNPEKKVAFICPAYNSYPQIISSLICQTHQNWELFLIHDGPNANGIQQLVNDPRIKYKETAERVGKWGHSIRQTALENIAEFCPDADYVVITNADNYHVPVYIEKLLKAFETNPSIVAAYCSDMVHSYKAWQIIPCRLQLGYIDCAGVMIKKEVAKEIGWRDIESHSSDWTYFNDIIKKYGADKWQKVPGCLLIHN